MLDMIHFSVTQGSIHPSIDIAVISLLLKTDKDPTSCSSYRPLSLIGIDVKLYAKVLSRHLEKFMNRLVHHDKHDSLNLAQLRITYAGYNVLLIQQIVHPPPAHYYL